MLLVPGLHMGDMTLGGRVYLLANGVTCVLIDTGAPDGTLGAGQLIEAAQHKPFEVRLILLTHAHPGHAGNVEALRRLTGAPVACSAEAAAMLSAPPRRPGVLGRWRRRGTPAPLRADRIVSPGERIELAGGIEVIDAPGHAPGCLVYHLRGPDALCLGDAATVTPEGLRPPPARTCADPPTAAATATGLAGRPARVLAPGHGYPSIDGRLPRRVR